MIEPNSINTHPKGMTPFTLETAMLVAVNTHKGQRDKGREPYILHPIRVMMAQDTITEKIAGILHDTVEDSKGAVTIESLRLMGCPEEVLEAIDLVTFPKGTTTEEYLARIRTIKLNRIATSVKLADLRDNLDLPRLIGMQTGFEDKDMARINKYLEALRILTGKAA